MRRGRRLDVEDPAERGRPCAPGARRRRLWRTSGRLAGRRRRAWRSGCAPGRVRWRWAMRVDAGRHGRREEHGLALGGRRGEDRLDVLGEAHVEHLVGLVEHDDLRRRRGAGVPRRMWSRARPGRGDDDVDAALERLRAGGRSAGRRRSGSTRAPSARPYRWIASDTCIASSRVGTRISANGSSAPVASRRRGVAGSAARTPRSCRCRWRPGRAGRGRRAAAGSPRAGSASAPRSRAWSARRAARGRSPRSANVTGSPSSVGLIGGAPRWDARFRPPQRCHDARPGPESSADRAAATTGPVSGGGRGARTARRGRRWR